MAKILIVSQYFWPEDFRINDLATIFKTNNHDVTILTGQPNYPSGTSFEGYKWWKFNCETHNGLEIYRVPLYPRKNGKAFYLVINYLSFIFFSFLVVPFFVFKKYDFVLGFGTSPIFQGLAGVLIAKLKRIPFKVWVMDLWPESLSATNTIRNPYALKFVGLFVKLFYKMSDEILCISKSFITHIHQQGVPIQKLKYFPNWAEDSYQNVQLKQPVFAFPRGTVITYAGNLGEAQDLETLIQAIHIVKNIPDLSFVILGDGRKKSWFEDQIQKLHLEKKVFILGRFPQEAMPYFFKNSTALLVTLRKDPLFSKVLPGRVQSFMAASKPIIACADGETADVIQQANCGFCSTPGDYQRLAESFITLAQISSSEIESLGLNSKKYFDKHFSRKNVIHYLFESSR